MQDTQIILFVLHIAGAAALLIWSVRLVRTGVERAFSTQLRLWLRRSTKSRFLAAGMGTAAAVFLQSSTAVAIMVSNFVSRGSIATAVGLAILLGADVGSAIVAQILLLRQDFLVPLLLLVGVALFLRGDQPRSRQVGRILIGLALIFVSLDMIRAATAPLLDSSSTLAVMQYLGRDGLTAFAIGAIFAWVVHSSVAAILLVVTLVAQGLLPAYGAAAMVLGANLGGAFIAYVLTLASPIPARRMVVFNLVLRGGLAALVLIGLTLNTAALGWLGQGEARQVINLHFAFNLALALLSLPFLGPIARLAEFAMPERSDPVGELGPATALDDSALDKPDQALVCTAREILAMGQAIEIMLRAVGGLYERWDAATVEGIRKRGETVRKMHFDLKLFLARLNRRELDEEGSGRSMELASLAVSFDAAAELVSRNLVELAKRLHAQGVAFSKPGQEEISDFHDRVLGNVQLALNVMMTQNPEEARELVAAKDKVRDVEQQMQRNHLGRLREGLAESIETSSIHQETLRALKQVNTSFTMVGYPILTRTGDLLSSRLSGADVQPEELADDRAKKRTKGKRSRS